MRDMKIDFRRIAKAKEDWDKSHQALLDQMARIIRDSERAHARIEHGCYGHTCRVCDERDKGEG